MVKIMWYNFNPIFLSVININKSKNVKSCDFTKKKNFFRFSIINKCIAENLRIFIQIFI